MIPGNVSVCVGGGGVTRYLCFKNILSLSSSDTIKSQDYN